MFNQSTVYQDVSIEFIKKFSAAGLDVGVTVYSDDATVKIARSTANVTDMGNSEYLIALTFYSNSFAVDWQGILEFDDSASNYLYDVIIVAKNPEIAESILIGAIITEDEIRTFLQDKTDLNLLLQVQEFTPKDINQAANMVLSKFNSFPPPLLKYTLGTFPEIYILLVGIASYLLKTKVNNFIRNKMHYQGGNFPLVEIEAKLQEYQGIAKELDAEFESLGRTLKIGLNAEQWTGTSHSPYSRYLYPNVINKY